MIEFLSDYYIKIKINKFVLLKALILVRIPQSSLISSILYLFYNVNLLKICDNIRLYMSVIRFMNDINILIYNKSIERNY